MIESMDLITMIKELETMEPELREIGEYRKANMINFAVGYLKKYRSLLREQMKKEILKTCDVENGGTNQMNINELVQQSHENAVNKGFWEDIDLEWHKVAFKNPAVNIDTNAIGNRLMLIVSELAEAQEGLRHNNRENFKEELADVCIRVFDLCGGLDIDLEAEIIKKMKKNKDRPYKHNKAF